MGEIVGSESGDDGGRTNMGGQFKRVRSGGRGRLGDAEEWRLWKRNVLI
jgi:hypothetical protein